MRNPVRVRFVRDVLLTGGTQIVQAGFAMIAGVLVARHLGASAKGTLSVLVALASMAVLLASLGIQFSGIYFLGRFKTERENIASNLVIVGVLGGLMTGIALSLVGVAFRSQLLGGISLSLFLLYVVSVPASYFNALGRAAVLGIGRVGVYNLRDLIEGAGLFAGTAVSILLFGERLGPLIALRVGIEILTALILFLYLRSIFTLRAHVSRKLLRRQMAYGVRNYASSLLWVFLLQSDLVLCNYFLGSGPTGVYSVAISLGLPVTILASVVGTLTFQRVSSNESREGRVANTNRTLRLMLPVVALAACFLAVSARWIVPLIYGSPFNGAAVALVLLLPGLFALSLELVVMNFLAGEGSPRIVYRAPFIGLVVNIAANLFVIPRWGINGAAVTSSVAYVIVLVLVFHHYLKETGSTVGEVAIGRLSDLRALAGMPTDSRHITAGTPRV